MVYIPVNNVPPDIDTGEGEFFLDALSNNFATRQRVACATICEHCARRDAPRARIIGASLSEPHIDELNVRNLYMYYYNTSEMKSSWGEPEHCSTHSYNDRQ